MKTLVLLFLAASTLWAADPGYEAFRTSLAASLPGRPTPLFDVSEVSRLPRLGADEDAAFSTVDVSEQPFRVATRVTVKRRTDPAWQVQLTSPASLSPIRKGDVLFVTFAARCTASNAETGGGHLFATLQQTQTFDSLASLTAAPGKEWVRFYLRTVAARDYPAQNVELVLHLGKVEQTLDVGGFLALNLGPGVDLRALPFTRIRYEGQGPDEAWRHQALVRIESIRKGDLAIQVRTAGGHAASNATVRVRMTRHAYQFGTFVEEMALRENADGRRYRETAVSLFNRATCPIYWTDWGWEDPEKRLTYIAIAQWAKMNGFHTRGHCLIWPGWQWLPKALKEIQDDPAELKAAIDSHFKNIVTIMRPIGFDTYDVVNEPRVNHAIQDILGEREVASWYKLTHAIDPRPVLGINEFAIVSGGGGSQLELELYMKQIRDLVTAGAPLGVIGVQCHMGENMTPPHKVIEILDRLASVRLPIHATEFDIATDDEETQGDYMRDFLIAFFSHPATESLTQWGFWEGSHWIPRAALFDKNWRTKPNGKAYLDLVKGAWWTDVTLTTDRQGYCRTRGFLGDYEVTVQLPDGTALTRPARITRAGSMLTVKP